MPQNEIRLAEVLASRLCHDLITPIGAINTGLELFEEASSSSPSDTKDILNLIHQSAETAAARVSLFRVAFGSSGGFVALGDVRKLLEAYYSRSKIDLHWKDPFPQDLSLDGWGRLLLNSAFWMGECAPRGGHIHITSPQEKNPFLQLHLKAESIILHQGTLEALEGTLPPEQLTPRTAPCYLIHHLVKENQYSLSVQHATTPPALTLTIQGGS